MDPVVWGSPMWKTIHYIALGYPDNASKIDKDAYYSYFTNLHRVIPCQECANHLEMLVKNIPVTTEVLSDNRSLFNWTVLIHNEVNKKLNKRIMSNDDAFKLYSKSDKEQQGKKSISQPRVKSHTTTKETKTPNRTSKINWICVVVLVILFMCCILSCLLCMKSKSKF